jgi:PhzF family phenazine biosynthesis protein
MTTLPLFQVDAFVAGRPLTGNPAAVMPLDRWLDDSVMQAIAAENNLAETAFTVATDADEADYELRWFTPTVEIGMGGHATLASGHVLMTGQRVRFATQSGILTVARAGELLELDMPAAQVEPTEIPELEKALGVGGETFLSRAGNGNTIVLLDDQAAVLSVRPDFAALAKLPYLVSVTAPGDEEDIASRVFATYHGVPEDPVTGSAHTALVPFWARRLGRDSFTALQASKRSGILHCRLEGDRVILGGRCATVIVGNFQL